MLKHRKNFCCTQYNKKWIDTNSKVFASLLGVRLLYSRCGIVFELTRDSVRTFKGCNVVWFTVFRKKRFKAQNYLVPTHSPWCSPILSSVNSKRALIFREEFTIIEESFRFLGHGSHSPLSFWASDHTTWFLAEDFYLVIPFCFSSFSLSLNCDWTSFLLNLTLKSNGMPWLLPKWLGFQVST